MAPSAIVLFVNPRSRKNRRDPGTIHRLRAVLGDAGELLMPAPGAELTRVAQELAAQPPGAIAIHGGDGTAHVILSALIHAFAGNPLPPIALLLGGTMNVVPRSLGLLAEPEQLLGALVRRLRQGAAIKTVSRRCLAIGDRHGFVFANGVFATFLQEYYATGSYGPGRAIFLGLQAAASDLLGGPFARKVLRPYEGRVIVDGVEVPEHRLTAVSAATVTQVGLGFKLNHRADEDPDRFSVVTVKASVWEIMASVPAVHAGRGFPPHLATARLASRLVLDPEGRAMNYTVDGDMYQTAQPLELTPGPVLRLVKP